ncbi:helix-turn-helix domain-containing protein [Methylomonas sp. MgM2]
MSNQAIDDIYISAAHAAKIIGVSDKTLANWRSSGAIDLPFYKPIGRVRYKKAEVLEFMGACPVTSTAQLKSLKDDSDEDS